MPSVSISVFSLCWFKSASSHQCFDKVKINLYNNNGLSNCCGILVLLARVYVNVSQCTPVHLRCLWKCDSWSVETIICLACSICLVSVWLNRDVGLLSCTPFLQDVKQDIHNLWWIFLIFLYVRFAEIILPLLKALCMCKHLVISWWVTTWGLQIMSELYCR